MSSKALYALVLPVALSMALELGNMTQKGELQRLWAVAKQTDLTFNLVSSSTRTHASIATFHWTLPTVSPPAALSNHRNRVIRISTYPTALITAVLCCCCAGQRSGLQQCALGCASDFPPAAVPARVPGRLLLLPGPGKVTRGPGSLAGWLFRSSSSTRCL
jgi:hypothetical protein